MGNWEMIWDHKGSKPNLRQNYPPVKLVQSHRGPIRKQEGGEGTEECLSPAQKHSAAGRHGIAPQGLHVASGVGTVEIFGEGGESRAECWARQTSSKVECGDPEETVRGILGLSLEGTGGDAAVTLVMRALAFCRDFLLRPGVATRILDFLGVQLHWLYVI